MKTLFLIPILLLLTLPAWGQQPEREKNDREIFTENDANQHPLDLATLVIKSPEAQRLLRTERLRIRNSKTTYLPQGEMPIIKVQAPDRGQCREILNGIVSINDHRPAKLKTVAGAMAMHQQDFSAWIHPASGGYKYTITSESMIKPTRFEDFKEAVQLGLTYIAQHQLVQLIEGEELDLISVSGVNNVLSSVEEPEQPRQQFVSDYYLAFGRRFKGIPIVGSHLTLRVDGEGTIAMVNKNWRPITGFERPIVIDETKLRERVFNHPEFRESYGGQNLSPRDIHFSRIQAGYIEAPFDFVQTRFRPGVVVNFWIGEARNEMDAELLLPFEEEVRTEDLLGNHFRTNKS